MVKLTFKAKKKLIKHFFLFSIYNNVNRILSEKKSREKYDNLSEEDQDKTENLVGIDIEIFLKMKN